MIDDEIAAKTPDIHQAVAFFMAHRKQAAADLVAAVMLNLYKQSDQSVHVLVLVLVRVHVLAAVYGNPGTRAESGQDDAGAGCGDAVHPDKAELLRIVAALRHTMGRATNISDEEREEFMSSTFADFERYEEELKRGSRKEGLREGLDEGRQAMRGTIVDMCELLGIQVSAEQQAQLAAMDLDQLVALKDHIKRTRSWTN